MVARCGSAARTFSWNLHATQITDRVTCLVCLYHLGLYVPLSKLTEHQNANRGGNYLRDPYAAVPSRPYL